MNNFSVDKIKEWLKIESEINQHSTELRHLRKKKKQLSVDIVEIMKQNNIDCLDCNSGQIMYTKNNIKKSLNKKMLQELLTKYFTNSNPEQAVKLCNFIQENRTIEVKENIKLKIKN